MRKEHEQLISFVKKVFELSLGICLEKAIN
jgi:hypothetical protein